MYTGMAVGDVFFGYRFSLVGLGLGRGLKVPMAVSQTRGEGPCRVTDQLLKTSLWRRVRSSVGQGRFRSQRLDSFFLSSLGSSSRVKIDGKRWRESGDPVVFGLGS